jgi:ABC-2 type transport system permease protein
MTTAGAGVAAGDGPRRVVEAPLVSPAADSGLLEVFRRRYLLRLLVRREVTARYSGSLLGLFWSYINPLSQFFIYYVVVGLLFQLHKDVQNFAIHMFAGLVVVHFFAETLNAGTRSIVRNRQVVQKMAVPREMFPAASMLVSLYHVIPQIVIMSVACLFLGWLPDPIGVAAGLLGMVLMATLGTALALVFSVANVYMRDISQAVSVLTNFIRFSVPMIYPYTMVEERFPGYTDLWLANPIAIAVLLLQRCFWVGTTDHPAVTAATELPPDLYQRGLVALGVSLVLLVIAQYIFAKYESKIPEML